MVIILLSSLLLRECKVPEEIPFEKGELLLKDDWKVDQDWTKGNSKIPNELDRLMASLIEKRAFLLDKYLYVAACSSQTFARTWNPINLTEGGPGTIRDFQKGVVEIMKS
jgi:hypothetical protein